MVQKQTNYSPITRFIRTRPGGMREAIESGPHLWRAVLDANIFFHILTVNILSVNICQLLSINVCQLNRPTGPAHAVGDVVLTTLGPSFSSFFGLFFRLIFDLVFVSKLGHFWSPKCAKMPPNGRQQMCLHNDVSKSRFLVVICPILDPSNPRG